MITKDGIDLLVKSSELANPSDMIEWMTSEASSEDSSLLIAMKLRRP